MGGAGGGGGFSGLGAFSLLAPALWFPNPGTSQSSNQGEFFIHCFFLFPMASQLTHLHVPPRTSM